MKFFKLIFLFLGFLLWGFSNSVIADPIKIVAAENFYGDIAKKIGGPYVDVTSILNNPNQDPHLFSASPSTAQLIAHANIIVYNGIAYDVWMTRLIAAQQKNHSYVIEVAKLMDKRMGDNPHLWYDPLTMPTYAKALTSELAQQDPAHRRYYFEQLQQFEQQAHAVLNQVASLKQRYRNISVIATEPLFNYMASAIGLKMYGEDFQLNVMNDIAPTASQTIAFENALRTHTVKVLIYNNQVSDPITQRMQDIAHAANIPVIGVSETQPAGKNYVQWMLGQLINLEQALASH